MAMFKKSKPGGLAPATPKHTVLLVDDEPDNLSVLRSIIGSRYNILEASDGQEALELVQAMPNPEQLTLVVSDQRMPHLTGVQLCEKLCEISPNTMRIIVTGFIDVDAIVDSVNRAQIYKFVVKPFDRHDFELTVQRAVETFEMKQALDDHLLNLERKVEGRTQELRAKQEELIEANDGLNQAMRDLRQSQAQLVKAEKMAALGQLVTGVAHQINTPVGVGVTAASALQERNQELAGLLANGQMKKSDLNEFLAASSNTAGMILENLRQASQLIQSFKEIAVDHAEPKRQIKLQPWLEETMAGMAALLRPAGIGYRVDCAPELELETYSDALSQIFHSLTQNVLAHAYPQGQGGLVTVSAELAGPQLRLRFGDDGAGIDPQHLPKIFDPFFTTKRGGGSSGLGLNLVYNLVTSTFNGSVECQSEAGRGCQFTILLPL